MATKQTANKGERKPAHQLLIEFLDKNDMSFLVRKQEVRFVEDNGILIEPPKIVIYYKDEVEANKVDLPKKE